MLYAETTSKTIKIYLDGTLVLHHSPNHPFLSVETGAGPRNAGGFFSRAVSSVFSKYRPLTEARYDEARKLLRLSHGDLIFSFVLLESDGTLFLRPHKYSEDITKLRLSFPATPDEPVYGCGGVWQAVNLRGKKVSLLASDPRRSISAPALISELLKKGDLFVSAFTLPTFVSSDFSAVCVNFSGQVDFDFTRSTAHFAEISGVPESVILTPSGTPSAYFKLLRRLEKAGSPIPPSWCSDGLIAGVSGGSSELLETIDRYRRAGVALSGLFIRDWSGVRKEPHGVEFWDWILSRDLYPHLDEVLKQLTSRGIRSLGYVNPHLCIEGRLFAEASKAGYLIKNREGANYLSDMGGFMAGHLDLTNPDACEWFTQTVHNNLLAIGFSGYCVDGGGDLPADCTLSSGENPLEIRNLWPEKWARLNSDIVRRYQKRDVFCFSSHGSPTMSALVHGSSMEWSHGSGLSSVLNEMLSLGFSGVGVSHCDAGLRLTSIPEHYYSEQLIRWAELSAFTPVMQSRGFQKELLDSIQLDDVLSHLARMSKLHRLLSPYLTECLRAYSLTGIPVLRHMHIVYPDSVFSADISSTQMMVGDELLVAPALQVGVKTRKIFLPAGEWIHLFSGQLYHEGEQEVECPPGSPPAFYLKDGKHARVFGSVAFNLV